MNILREFDLWFKPELRFAICADDVNVHAGFFPRKEKEPISSFSMDGRRQRTSQSLMTAKSIQAYFARTSCPCRVYFLA
jgi:hypothetical protein